MGNKPVANEVVGRDFPKNLEIIEKNGEEAGAGVIGVIEGKGDVNSAMHVDENGMLHVDENGMLLGLEEGRKEGEVLARDSKVGTYKKRPRAGEQKDNVVVLPGLEKKRALQVEEEAVGGRRRGE
jgi:hypothetical protein